MRKVNYKPRRNSWKQPRPLVKSPQAIQLRYLQTLVEVAGDKTNTIIFPLPMDLIEPLLLKTQERLNRDAAANDKGRNLRPLFYQAYETYYLAA